MEESVNHLFFGCNYYGNILFLILQWLYIHSADLIYLFDHLTQYKSLEGESRKYRSSLQLIWLLNGMKGIVTFFSQRFRL